MAQVRDAMMLEIGDYLNKLNTVDQRLNKVLDRSREVKASVKVDSSSVRDSLRNIPASMLTLSVRLSLKQTDIRDALKDVKNYVGDIGKMDLSALIKLRDQLKKHIEELRKAVADMRALGGNRGGSGGGSGNGGSGGRSGSGNSGLSAGNRALLNELDRINNAYKRGEMSATAYDRSLRSLQAGLRASASNATRGTAEFAALDRAITSTTRSLAQINARPIAQLRNDLSAASNAFREASANATTLAQRQAATAQYRAELQRVKAALEGMVASGRLTAAQLAQVQGQLARVGRESERLNRAAAGGRGGLFANMANGAQQLMGYIPGFNQFSSFFDTMPAKAMAVAAAFTALAAGIGASFRSAAEFQAVMVDIKALTAPSPESMGALNEAAKGYEFLGISATDAAGAALALNKAGLETADVVGGGMAGALSLAGAAGVTAAEGGEMAVTAMTAFGMTAADLPKIADTYANFANKTVLSAQDLSMGLAAVGPVAKSAGLSFNEFAGYMASLAQGGFRRMDDAGTSLKTMLLSLQAPVGASSEAIKKLKLNVYDAAGQMRPLGEILDELRQKTASMSEQDRNATLKNLFGTDGIRAAQILMGDYSQSLDANSQAIRENIEAMGLQGEAARVAEERMQSYAGQSKVLGANWTNFKIAVGEAFLPSATAVVKGLNSMVEAGQNAMNHIEDWPDYLLPVAVVLGTIYRANLLAGATAAWAWVGTLPGLFAAAQTAVVAFGTAVAAMSIIPAFAVAAAGVTIYANSIINDIERINEAANDSDNQAFEGLMSQVRQLRSTGDELDAVKARYLLALEAMNEAGMGEIKGTDIWGNVIREVDEEDLARKQQAVKELRDEMNRISEARKNATADDGSAAVGGPVFAPEQIDKQTEALKALRQELDGRALRLELEGKEGVDRELTELGNTFDDLREKLKAPFYLPDGTLGMTPELQKALSELDYQREVESRAVVEKSLEDQAKMRLDKEREIQGMRLDLMRDGQGKLHAQAAADIEATTAMWDEAISEAKANRDAEGLDARQRERFNNEVIALEKLKAEEIGLINQRLHQDLAKLDREQLERLKASQRELLSAQASAAGAMTSLLEGQRDRAIELAGESASERLAIERSFAPQLARLAAEQAALEGQARRAELQANLEKDLQDAEGMGDRRGAAETAARQQYSAELRSLELSEQAARESAAAASEKRIRDAEKAVLQERADEYQKMLDKRLKGLDKASAQELSSLARTLQADRARALAQGNDAQVKIIDSGLEKIMEQAAQNAERFADALKSAADKSADLRGQLAKLGFTDLEKAVDSAASPYDSIIEGAQEQLKELREGFRQVVNPDPQTVAAFRQQQAELTGIVLEAQTGRQRAMATAEAQFQRERNDTAQQAALQRGQHELAMGRLTMGQYAELLAADSAYWETRLANAEQGTEDYRKAEEALRSNESARRSLGDQFRQQQQAISDLKRRELDTSLALADSEAERAHYRQQLLAFDRNTLARVEREIAALEASGANEQRLVELRGQRLDLQQQISSATEQDAEAARQHQQTLDDLNRQELETALELAGTEAQRASLRQQLLDLDRGRLAAVEREIAALEASGDDEDRLLELRGERLDLQLQLNAAVEGEEQRARALLDATRSRQQAELDLAEKLATSDGELMQVRLANLELLRQDARQIMAELAAATDPAEVENLRAKLAQKQGEIVDLDRKMSTAPVAAARQELDLTQARARAHAEITGASNDAVAAARLEVDFARENLNLTRKLLRNQSLSLEERQTLLKQEAEQAGQLSRASEALSSADRERARLLRELRIAHEELNRSLGEQEDDPILLAYRDREDALRDLQQAEAEYQAALDSGDYAQAVQATNSLTQASEAYRASLRKIVDTYREQISAMKGVQDAAWALADAVAEGQQRGFDPKREVERLKFIESRRKAAARELQQAMTPDYAAIAKAEEALRQARLAGDEQQVKRLEEELRSIRIGDPARIKEATDALTQLQTQYNNQSQKLAENGVKLLDTTSAGMRETDRVVNDLSQKLMGLSGDLETQLSESERMMKAAEIKAEAAITELTAAHTFEAAVERLEQALAKGREQGGGLFGGGGGDSSSPAAPPTPTGRTGSSAPKVPDMPQGKQLVGRVNGQPVYYDPATKPQFYGGQALMPIERVLDGNGKVIWEWPPQAQRTLDQLAQGVQQATQAPPATTQLRDVLQEAINRPVQAAPARTPVQPPGTAQAQAKASVANYTNNVNLGGITLNAAPGANARQLADELLDELQSRFEQERAWESPRCRRDSR